MSSVEANAIGVCFKYLLIISALWTRVSDVEAAVAKNSSPFDPFRLECPFFHGIVKLDLQRVESSEGVRTDTMITSFCENIKKIYPSPRDPTLTTADETCRWTNNFRIPQESFDFTETCNGREFVSGISRQAAGEYGVLCCKIKDRRKGNCGTVQFSLPTASSPVFEVETGKRILTGIGHENGRLTAQFCDMAIMTKKEVDEEFIANARAQLLAQGDDKIGNPLTRDTAAEITTRRPVPRPLNNRASPGFSAPGIRPPAGFSQSRSRPAANPSRPSANSLTDDEDNDNQRKPNNVARLAVIKNAISAPAQGAVAKNVRPSAVARLSNGAATAKTPTKTTESIYDSEDPETTAARSRASKKAVTTSAAPESSEEEQTESETEKQTSAKAKTTKSSKVTTTEPTAESTTIEDAISPDPARYQVLGVPRPAGSEFLKPQPSAASSSPAADQTDDPDQSSAASTKSTKKLNSLPPAPPARHEVTLPQVEPDDGDSSPTTPIEPDETESPAPEEPATKAPKKTKAKEESETTTEALAPEEPTTKAGKKKKAKEESEVTTENPEEPEAKVTDDKPKPTPTIGKGKEAKPTSAKPKNVKAKIEKPEGKEEEKFAAPNQDIGNVSAISNGIVLSSRNSIESAVAPAKPLFTVMPPPPKFEVGSVGNEKKFINPDPSVPSLNTTIGLTTPATTLSTTTGISRLECHTNSAFRDPQSNLVVACGQGDDIWVPSRCQPGLLCLLAKDSSYRLCCSVRI